MRARGADQLCSLLGDRRSLSCGARQRGEGLPLPKHFCSSTMGRLPLAAALLALLGLAAVTVGVAASSESAISLSGVTVSVLESSGSAAATHSVAGPDAGLQLDLDHTQTLKVGSAAGGTATALLCCFDSTCVPARA